MGETIGLKFSKIKVKYTQQKIGGWSGRQYDGQLELGQQPNHVIGGAMFWYVYKDAWAQQRQPKKGDGNCVALVQNLSNVGHTKFWSPGLRVMDCVHLPVGCVIATFEQGRYANRPKGNHACLFLEFGPTSQTTGKPTFIRVMDQWNGGKIAMTASGRFLRQSSSIT